jgi:radical SAM superfamily enzyme YgiQ (UPF0313 family)
MKILLIYPPEKHLMDTKMPEILEEGIGYSPPLGLMTLASCVLKFSDWDVEIIDALAEELTYEMLEKRIRASNPDVVGITVMTNKLVDCTLVAKIVKKINPDIKVIFGGAHVTIYPLESLHFPFVDYVVIVEGDRTLPELLNCIGNDKNINNVKGVYYKDKNGTPIFTGNRELIKDLDEIPFPARDLINKELYSSTLSKSSYSTTLISSRGCPYQCIFCNRPHWGKVFRARSAKNVVDEMEQCANEGIEEILIYDDTFTVDRKRVVEICNEIKKRNIKIWWDIRARVNTVDYDLLQLMKSAGCVRIHYGVESGNDKVLRDLQKGITKKQALEAFRLTKKVGIETLAYFMIGCPGETRETIMETIRFAKKLNPDYCHIAIFIPMPATPIYTIGIEKGILSGDKWQEFAQNPTPNFIPELWIENVSEKELKQLLKKAYSDFYIRPGYILRSTLRVRSPKEFIKKAKAGLQIFRLHFCSGTYPFIRVPQMVIMWTKDKQNGVKPQQESIPKKT